MQRFANPAPAAKRLQKQGLVKIATLTASQIVKEQLPGSETLQPQKDSAGLQTGQGSGHPQVTRPAASVNSPAEPRPHLKRVGTCFYSITPIKTSETGQGLSKADYNLLAEKTWRWGDSNPRHRGCKPRALPLSYIPVLATWSQWAYLDSNQGPQLYQSCALAN